MSAGNRKRRKALGLLPARDKCAGHNRFGEPCGNYPIEGGVVCRSHGGSAPQVKRKAEERIAMAKDDAAWLLVQFMADENVPYSERRRIAEFLLTYESRNELKLQLAPWQEMLGDLVLKYDPGPEKDETITLSPDDDGAWVPDEKDARWEGMPRRRPTGDPRPADPPPPRRRRPDFGEPNAPGYATP